MSALPTPEELARLSKQLRAQAKAVAALARAVSPAQPEKLAKGLEAVRKLGAADVPALVAATDAWLVDERAGRRERLDRGLREACTADGIEYRVVGREPLELRLAPVNVRVDVERDRAEVVFGELVVETCRADAGAILAARRTSLAALEPSDWSAPAFHRQLRKAWTRVRTDAGQDIVELADVLPEVAMLVQPRAFLADPLGAKFKPYPKVRFLYDLWRLQRERCLEVDGWRLSLGDATGGSTKDRQRVFSVPGALGEPQFKLTLRFAREELPR